MEPSEYLATAVDLLGGPAKVARDRGFKTSWAVQKWINDGLPADHVLWLAEQTGWRVTPHQLAPALYPHPDDGLPDRFRGGRLRKLDEAIGLVGQQTGGGNGKGHEA